MSTFAKATFNAGAYSSFRPTYPKVLYETVYSYHANPAEHLKWQRAVDLGCGTGQATQVLADSFDEVLGLDPSAGMVQKAHDGATQGAKARPRYLQGQAEKLSMFQDETVDLVTAGQAAHWFDYTKIWPEVARVLKKGGTAAFWGYSELRFPKHPSLTPKINAYSSDPTQNLGPYWEQPGRSILDSHLQPVPLPSSAPWDASSRRRVYFAGKYANGDGEIPIDIQKAEADGVTTELREIALKKRLDWKGLENYLRTWSSLHTFHAKHPEDKTAEGGDIVDRFLKVVQDGVKEDGEKDAQGIDIEWPMSLIMIKKAS